MVKFTITLLKGLLVFIMALFIIPYEIIKRNMQNVKGR
jgi:hypothetical protein